MLEEEEFKHVTSLRGTGTEGDLRERQFGPVLREYERITGFRETNPRISRDKSERRLPSSIVTLRSTLSALRKAPADASIKNLRVLHEAGDFLISVPTFADQLVYNWDRDHDERS